jgi:uncharacterized membrane protein YedE/YeeE
MAKIPRVASNAGGIAGSGIFGMFGTIVNCSAESNSMYCSLMKAVNVVAILLIIAAVLYYAYTYLSKK